MLLLSTCIEAERATGFEVGACIDLDELVISEDGGTDGVDEMGGENGDDGWDCLDVIVKLFLVTESVSGLCRAEAETCGRVSETDSADASSEGRLVCCFGISST